MQNTIGITIAVLLLSLCATFVSAAGKNDGQRNAPSRVTPAPTVTQAWVRATVPGQPVGAAYMKISSSTDATLIKVETPVAKAVEFHNMRHENGVMQMRALGSVNIAAGTTVDLAPGGMHLMLTDLKKPLIAGETIQLKMTFVGTVNTETVIVVELPIRPLGQ